MQMFRVLLAVHLFLIRDGEFLLWTASVRTSSPRMWFPT